MAVIGEDKSSGMLSAISIIESQIVVAAHGRVIVTPSLID